MKYFDSHAHYYDERFSEELSGGVDNLIGTLLSENVSYIINIGTNPETSRAAISQAKMYENMYTAVGIHPSDTRFLSDMEAELLDIESLILDKANKCVCLGEIGLDYHYPDTDKEKQAAYFEAQMCLAERLGIPVCIHDREAHADVMDVIRRHPSVRGVLHSFSGSAEMAEELVKLGWMISFSGTLTFTNAKKPREVAARIPKESVMIETDCPYLAPHPKRGSLNHSGNLEYTNAVLASIWGVSAEECAAITENNAKRFFGL
ncbi:MAG: TatD family deoxyribonuclease [Ruminococcaceae bacterium]|nr:TatD family deoxyribonuclease [Oscillospiraceae bacterium]